MINIQTLFRNAKTFIKKQDEIDMIKGDITNDLENWFVSHLSELETYFKDTIIWTRDWSYDDELNVFHTSVIKGCNLINDKNIIIYPDNTWKVETY